VIALVEDIPTILQIKEAKYLTIEYQPGKDTMCRLEFKKENTRKENIFGGSHV